MGRAVSSKPTGDIATRGRCGPGGCSICRHHDRDAIDHALAFGASIRATAQRFGLHYDSVHRHAANHLSASDRVAIVARSKPSLLMVADLIDRLMHEPAQ